MGVGSGVTRSLGPPSVEGHAAEVDAAEAVSMLFRRRSKQYQMSFFMCFLQRGRHLPNFCQHKRMGNITPHELTLRHLSIPAQGWRRFDDKGADRSGVVELN